MYGGRFIPWPDRAPPEPSGLPDLVQDFWHKGSSGNGQRGATFALARKCRTAPLRRLGAPLWPPLSSEHRRLGKGTSRTSTSPRRSAQSTTKNNHSETPY